MVDNYQWAFSKNEDQTGDKGDSPNPKSAMINTGCSICGRIGHVEQACAASIQIFEW